MMMVFLLHGFEGSGFVSFSPNIRRSAAGTGEGVAVDGELDSSGNDILFDELIASDTPSIIDVVPITLSIKERIIMNGSV